MKRFRLLWLCMALLLAAVQLYGKAPRPANIWKNVSGMRGQTAWLYSYPAPAELNMGITVVVCPGGSYSHTMGIKTEGFEVAEWLNSRGINAFVLRYRTGNKGYHHPAMIQDLQRALQIVRENEAGYNIDSGKVGVAGFSAGGHLVLMSGAFRDRDFLAANGLKTSVSLAPDFVVAIYPVVSMQDSIVHERSRRNLLTRKFTDAEKDEFSMERQMTADMPPVFLSACKDDPVVMFENSKTLAGAMEDAGVFHTFVSYETGGHGYGGSEDRAPEAAKWKYEFVKWLFEDVYPAN